jgi:hypothetical protein
MEIPVEEAAEDIHQRREADHEEQVLELQVEERDPLVEITMYRRHFERHSTAS